MKKVLNKILSHDNIGFLLLTLPIIFISKTVEEGLLIAVITVISVIITKLVTLLTNLLLKNKKNIYMDVIIISIVVSLLEVALSFNFSVISDLLINYIPLIAINTVIILYSEKIINEKANELKIKQIVIRLLYFVLAVIIFSLINELLGQNTITIMDKISSITGYKAVYINIFSENLSFIKNVFSNPGAKLISIALLIAITNKIRKVDNDGIN